MPGRRTHHLMHRRPLITTIAPNDDRVTIRAAFQMSGLESDGLRDAADVPARRCSRSSGRDQPGVQRAPVPGAAARDGPPHPWPAGVLLTVKVLRAVAPEI